ncbi:MAG TPA: rhodanese-like domain-containing protein [Clostridia bacterium]|nr:rhodanese-like domain-containing protein [Clostridia bacterium]
MFDLFKKNTYDSLNVHELGKLLGKVNLIDIRETYEYNSGHLPTAKNIPMSKIVSEAELHLDKSKNYYIICQSGARSSRTCDILSKKGFNVINVAGGTGSYRDKLE